MFNFFLFLPIAVSFLVSLFTIPIWIKMARKIGLVWPDMNEIEKNKVAGSGGIIAVLAFVIGILVLIAYRTFIVVSDIFLVEMLAMLTAVLFLAGIGLIDDLIGWYKGGLKKLDRILLVIIASVPLVAINAGKSVIGIPFLGSVELGIIYPLLLIPIGIVGAATTFNFLAGFNGLEAGQGIILIFSLGLVAFFTGNTLLSLVAFCAVASLLGFIFYNFHPAKVFPGDSLTYAFGGLIAIISILGNFERIALFMFIPYIIEVCLKSRGRLNKYSFGNPRKDGSLELKYDKIYSLNHLAIYLMNKRGIKATQKKVVLSIWLFQIVFVILGFIIYRGGIF